MNNKMFHQELIKQLKEAKKVLVLAVGGGNDSVSTLLLQTQLYHSFLYHPEQIDIVAMLPDCLDYTNMTSTNNHLLHIIESNSNRSVQGYEMKAFPEKILSMHKKDFQNLPIRNIYGISMEEGSIGVKEALKTLISENNFDLVLAIDVGGDFIADEENIEVLSPMMDGYMLYALKELNKEFNISMVYGIFGLGTDGESTPEMLKKSLSNIPYKYEGEFKENEVKEIIDFYRNVVEKNRYSRTTDFTIQEIQKIPHNNPALFRGRFHVKQNEEEKASVHFGNFEHTQDPYFFGKYYLFNDFSSINNPFAIKCSSGIEWFIKIQNQKTKINHELNGQSYSNIGKILKNNELSNISLFFGTPSRKFDQNTQYKIVKEIETSINNSIYELVIVYSEHSKLISNNIIKKEINKDLTVIGKNETIINKFIHSINKIKNDYV